METRKKKETVQMVLFLYVILFIFVGVLIISSVFSLIGAVLGITFGAIGAALGFAWQVIFSPAILVVFIIWLVYRFAKKRK
jgi:uncharacterized BrkB/YihY/UPF0761 family membrane protein